VRLGSALPRAQKAPMPTKTSRSSRPPYKIDVRGLMASAVAWPLFLMVLVVTWLGVQVHRYAGASAELEHTIQVIAAVHAVEKRVLDEETGLRAFLLTADQAFLAPYEEARPDEAMDRLDRLVAGSPSEAATQAVRSRYVEWHQHAQEAIASPAGARSAEAMFSRKAEMDFVRALIKAVVDRESAARAARARVMADEARVTEMASVALLVGVGAALSMVSRKKLRQVAESYEEALDRSARSEAALATLVEREREARERAEHALRARDEFLCTLSHELRTPLTAILGWSGVLKTRRLPLETTSRALAAIERNAKVQAQIVEDILDASRIVSGKFRLRVAATDVAAIVHAALDVVRFSAESKGVNLETSFEPGPISIVADGDRLQQIVWNLLSNAIKFTPRTGHVRITVRRADGRVTIEVWDNGEGIEPDFLPHVFERFRQADSSSKRRHGGLGLGLALVKHLVDLHGGEVRVESEGLGRGAVFTVALPVGVMCSTPPSVVTFTTRPRIA
jgi:signal transduction histidine kinase